MSTGEGVTGWVERDGIRTPLGQVPPDQRPWTIDGDLYGHVGGVDATRLHVRLRDGGALCNGRGVYCTPSRYVVQELCRRCLRIIRGGAPLDNYPRGG